MELDKYHNQLKGNKILPYQFSIMISEIYQIKLSGTSNESEIDGIVSVIKNKVLEMKVDLATTQMNYAINLATAKGDLLYEEMHKLFSLRNEIFALEEMGFSCNESLKKDVDNALMYRFKKEPQKAKMVAEDKLKDWNCDLWWYKNNLS
jgi:hypothetical protein